MFFYSPTFSKYWFCSSLITLLWYNSPYITKEVIHLKKIQLFSAALISTAAVVAAAPAADASFSDVPANYFFADAINYLAEEKIITGFEDGTFRPNDTLTREQAAIIIARALNLNLEEQYDLAFKDVPTTAFGYKHIAALYNAGIINGVSATEFKPNDTVTRGQIAKMLVNGFNLTTEEYETAPFHDIKNTYAEYEINTLYHTGITKGISPTEFGFNEKITRGQIAQLVYNIERYYASFYELSATEFGYDFIFGEIFDHVSEGAVEFVSYYEDNDKYFYLKPVKEGSDYFFVADYLPGADDPFIGEVRYFRSDVTTVDGYLNVTLTELDEPIFHLGGIENRGLVDFVLTDTKGTVLTEVDYVIHEGTEGYSVVFITKGEGDYIFHGKYNDGNEYVYGIQIRHEIPYTLITFGEYYEEISTVDAETVAEYYGFDLSSVTKIKTSVYDEESYDFIYGDDLIKYDLTTDEFKFTPLIDGIMSIEFYHGEEYLGSIEVIATKHGKGYILE